MHTCEEVKGQYQVSFLSCVYLVFGDRVSRWFRAHSPGKLGCLASEPQGSRDWLQACTSNVQFLKNKHGSWRLNSDLWARIASTLINRVIFAGTLVFTMSLLTMTPGPRRHRQTMAFDSAMAQAEACKIHCLGYIQDRTDVGTGLVSSL